MQSAELDQVTVDVTDGKGTTLRATGSIVAFDGFLKLYREDTDDAAEEDDSRMLPPMAERDPLKPRRRDGGAALHPAAAALLRSQPGEEDGGTGHRPALHLRLDPVGAAGPQICPAGQAPLHPGGPRPPGHRVPGELLRALRRYRLHRLDGGEARRDRRRRYRMAGDAARLLGRVLPRGRSDQGPQDQRRDRGAGRGPRPALLPRARGRHRSAPLRKPAAPAGLV